MSNTFIFFCAVGAVGVGLLAYGIRILSGKVETITTLPVTVPENTAIPSLEEQNITFKAVSQLWARDQLKKVRFADLARCWRNIEETPEVSQQAIEFRHTEIFLFYTNSIKGQPFFVGSVHDAAVEILTFLDEHGDCPSVVNLHKDEPEAKSDDDTYKLLEAVPLYLHSIHVAEEVIMAVPQKAIVPKAVLAALAHDLGKIPAFYGRFYHSGIHPIAGIAVIETLEKLRNLKYFNDIKNAVRLHHGQSNDYLDTILRDSDHAARRREICAQTGAIVEGEKSATDSAAAGQPTQQNREAGKSLKEGETDIFGNGASSADLVGANTDEKKRVPRKKLDIAAWFEPERFLKDLADIVNRIIPGDPERFWSALSLDGYVYIKPKPFWKLIQFHSNNHDQVAAAAMNEQVSEDIIYSVVMELTARPDTVAAEFLGQGYYGTLFLHNPQKNGGTKLFLIPFRLEAFGDSLANVESRKNTLMQLTTEIISVYKKRTI